MTYSIVARHPSSGQFGIAIRSHFFCVGDGPPWVEAGVGAVCTQAFTEPAYGPDGLARLGRGETAQATVEQLVAADARRDRRQVGVVDRHGGAFAFTGERCLGHAGHCLGEGVTAQANMVSSATIWTAMVREYEAASGELADRLVAALFAAEAEGGDSRGRQSAALIVAGDGGDAVNLRVDDHPEPLTELSRLLGYRRAYASIGRALSSALVDAAEPADIEDALAELRAAASTLADNPEATFWEGVVLARSGRIDEARRRFEVCANARAGWMDLVRRLPASGLLSEDVVSLVASPPA